MRCRQARDLKVDAVLEGTYLHVGDQLRVTVNLLRVEDGASLWAEKFDERFIDIFSIQDRVSRQVAQRLQLKLSPAQQARLSKRYTSDLQAYSFYTKAMYHFYNIRLISALVLKPILPWISSRRRSIWTRSTHSPMLSSGMHMHG